MNSLPSHLQNRSLVCVRRRDVDDYGIQGFVVGLSETLLALEYVYDFQLDGLLILRRADITEVRRTGTDEFQEQLLKKEGVRSGQQKPNPLNLENWRTIIDQLAAHYQYMILERELGPSRDLAIGQPLKTTTAQVQFRTFSGTGKWHAKTERLKYSEITSLQANTRYIGFYQRHFERSAA